MRIDALGRGGEVEDWRREKKVGEEKGGRFYGSSRWDGEKTGSRSAKGFGWE